MFLCVIWLPNVKVRLVEASEDGGSKVNDVDSADLFRGSKVTERGREGCERERRGLEGGEGWAGVGWRGAW